jgi:hypothetical protein
MKPLEDIGQRYYEHRQAIMEATQLGLTKTYNRFHDPEDQSEDIQQLRALHTEMDLAVAEAYGWFDEQTLAKHPDWEPLDLAHDFYDTPQGIRFTISPDARREVLDRLLELNHTRYAAEKKKGLHTKKSKGKSKKNKNNKKPKETPKKATPKANPKADNIELFASLPEVLPPARPKESHTSTDPEGE